MARIRLRKFEEELQTAIEAGMNTYSGHSTWNFVNGVLYCFDISTTIGEIFVSHCLTNMLMMTMGFSFLFPLKKKSLNDILSTENMLNHFLYRYLGYGHISPRTVGGRLLTIVYAIFGIPIFLILLADFGKLFTRIIKFLWVR